MKMCGFQSVCDCTDDEVRKCPYAITADEARAILQDAAPSGIAGTRWLLRWWRSLPCRHCQGSGLDEGFAFGRWYSIPCGFCEAASAIKTQRPKDVSSASEPNSKESVKESSESAESAEAKGTK
jgi:hypothetical protein